MSNIKRALRLVQLDSGVWTAEHDGSPEMRELADKLKELATAITKGEAK